LHDLHHVINYFGTHWRCSRIIEIYVFHEFF
jgi:hypothetical protein